MVELDHDGTWLIAKQQHLRRRSGNDSYEEPNPGVFSFWIIRMDARAHWGPLSEAEFETKRHELGVPAYLKLHDVYDYRPVSERER